MLAALGLELRFVGQLWQPIIIVIIIIIMIMIIIIIISIIIIEMIMGMIMMMVIMTRMMIIMVIIVRKKATSPSTACFFGDGSLTAPAAERLKLFAGGPRPDMPPDWWNMYKPAWASMAVITRWWLSKSYDRIMIALQLVLRSFLDDSWPAPRWLQHGYIDGSEMAPRWLLHDSIMAPRWFSNFAVNSSIMIPWWFQNGPPMAPKWCPDVLNSVPRWP